MNDRTIIHIGLPKTATTLLQNDLFRHLPKLAYAGIPYEQEADRWLVEEVVTQPDFFALPWQDLTEHAAAMKERAKRTDRRLLLISDESIGNTTLVPRLTKFFRLARLFPGAHWIVSVREPASLMESVYLWDMRCLEFGDRTPFLGFAEWFRRRWSHFETSNLSVVHGGRVVGELAEMVGLENVTVVPFEWLKTEPEQFISAYAKVIGFDAADWLPRLLGGKANERLSLVEYEFLALLPKVLRAEKPAALEDPGEKTAEAPGVEIENVEEPPEPWDEWIARWAPGQSEFAEAFKNLLPLDRASRRAAFFEHFRQLPMPGAAPARIDHDEPAFASALQQLRARVQPGFQWLQRATGVDLESLGYPVKDDAATNA